MFTISELQAAREQGRLDALRCPHCCQKLKRHIALVFATRNCPGCGKLVVAEPEGDPGLLPLTREQLDSACAEYRRTTTRAAWTLFAALLLLYTGLFAWNLFNETVAPILYPAVFLMLVAYLPAGTVAVWGVRLLRRANRAALKRPSCASPCSRATGRQLNVTQLSGNCTGCGRRLIDRPTEELADPLPSVEGYEPAATRRFWRSALGLTLLVAVMTVLCISLQLIWDELILPEAFSKERWDRHGPLGATRLLGYYFVGAFVATQAITLAGLYVLYHFRKRIVRANPILSCPHCHGELVPMSKVIATQRCPKCRKRVLADPEPRGGAIGVALGSPGG